MSGHAIWTNRPLFSPRRNRPPARRRRKRWRRNRPSARFSRPTSVICSAESAAGGGIGRSKQSNRAPFRGRRLRYVLGGIFTPWRNDLASRADGGDAGRRRCLSGLASVISPPASTSRADGGNVGDDIERIAPLAAAPLCSPPEDVAEQAEQTNARASSQRRRLFFGLAIAIFPAELTTRREGPRRGAKICTNRHLAIVAQVMFLAEGTM